MLLTVPVVQYFGRRHWEGVILCPMLGTILGWRLAQSYESPLAVVTGELFFAALCAVALIDMDTLEIPDGFPFILLLLGVISCWTMPGPSVFSRIIGMFCVSIPMFLICMAVEEAFGGGDIKLMAASGFFLGWKLSLFSLFIAILSGGSWGMILLLRKRVKGTDHFAFGPFLCIGMTIALLWGEDCIRAYLALCGL